jgi:UDP-3-O-[3-hydroxymyristoyl] glucosamine N-acyltransferase
LAKPALTLRDIVDRLGGEAVGEVPSPLVGVATLDSAGPGHVSFLANPRYRSRLATTRAGAVILAAADRASARGPCIVTPNPYAYYARAVALFHPPRAPRPGVHASAVIDPSARIDPSAEVGPHVVIGAGSKVGAGAVIGAGCFLGEGVAVGEGTRLVARVTIYDGCTLGARGLVHAGAVIGADGFGHAPDGGSWVKIPQVGSVRIGDDVEVGANTTIDRGALDDTVVGDGVKLDNQVQVGHNVVIGEHTVIAGCVGIAGSTTIGKRCMIGGAAGFIGHLGVCDGVTVSAMTLVTKSITKPGTYTAGMPMMEHADWLRNAAHLRRLDALAGKLRRVAAGDESE